MTISKHHINLTNKCEKRVEICPKITLPKHELLFEIVRHSNCNNPFFHFDLLVTCLYNNILLFHRHFMVYNLSNCLNWPLPGNTNTYETGNCLGKLTINSL